MTSPQNPWQSDPSQSGPWQQGQYPQQPGYPQGTPSGGFPQPGFPQQPGYAGNPYAAPPISPDAMGQVPRPATVNAAFWIAIIVPILVTVIMAIQMVFTIQLVDQTFAEREFSGQTEDVRAAVGGIAIVFFAVVIFFSAVLTTLWIVFGFKMRAGRNWARVTLTVFASIWLLFTLPSLITGGMTFNMAGSAPEIEMPAGMTALGITSSAITVAAMITFIVLVFLRSSNWYFQAARYR